MTDEERALVIAALLLPLRHLPTPVARTALAPSAELRRLNVDTQAVTALLDSTGDARPSLNAAFAAALEDIERSRPLRTAEAGWRAAPNPFSAIELASSSRGIEACPTRVFTPEVLTQSAESSNDPTAVLAGMERALTRVWREAPDFERVVWSLLAVQQRYLWFAPWSPQLDLPLPQSARVFAADALCRLRSAGGEEPLQLVMGDVSGIQKYLLAVTSSPQWGGAARRLRARSLTLQLLADVASHRVLHALDLPPSNLLMSAGGRFALLAPTNPATNASLQRLRQCWDAWLQMELQAEVNLHLALAPITAEEIGHAGEAFTRLSACVGDRKLQPMEDVLQGANGWESRPFMGEAVAGTCAGCGRGRTEPETGLCRQCERDVQVGALLPRTERLAYRRDAAGLIPLLGYSVDLLGREEATPLECYLVAATRFPATEEGAMLPVRPLATYIPMEGGSAVRFEQLAAAGSRGRPYLGYVKMDVDRMGAVLAWGLCRQEERGFDALPRLLAIGDWLEWYFAGFVGELVRRPEWRNVYLVFAGGDDLLAIAPWEQALAFAAEVQRGFEQLCRHNPAVTLSAGLALGKPKYPVAPMVGLATDELSIAKGGSSRSTGGRPGGRNSLSVLEDRMAWENWASLQQDLALLTNREVPSALLQVLLECAQLWQRFQAGDLGAARFVPLLSYIATRTVDRRQVELDRYVRTLVRLPLDTTQSMRLDHLGTVVKLAIAARGANEKEERTG